MDYSKELKRINDKYYEKIKEQYEPYVKNFSKVPNMTKKVFIIPDGKCIGKHKDLNVTRSKCLTKNGYIFIKESLFNEHIVVREFINRLSRNFKHINKFKFCWVIGIAFKENGHDYFGLNATLNEWLTYKITNHTDEVGFQSNFWFMKMLLSSGCKEETLKQSFFNNDYKTISIIFNNSNFMQQLDALNLPFISMNLENSFIFK